MSFYTAGLEICLFTWSETSGLGELRVVGVGVIVCVLCEFTRLLLSF